MCMLLKLVFSIIIIDLIFSINYVDGENVYDHKNWKLLPRWCGNRNKKVVFKVQGGVPSIPGKHPWMVNLFFSKSEYSKQEPMCGGSVISKKYILTAAHCCSLKGGHPIIVRVGEFNLKTSKNCTKLARCNDRIQDVEIESAVVHPGFKVSYKFGWAHNDICLIRLKTNIVFDQYVEPICLPKGYIAKTNKVGEVMEFAGWGTHGDEATSSVLREAKLTVISSAECDERLHKLISHDSSKEFCVQGNNQKFCYGDSGGPLVYSGGRKTFSVFGVASYSTEDLEDNNCEDDSPMVFTDVTKFTNWILDNIKP